MTKAELLTYLGVAPQEASKAFDANREMPDSELHIIRLFLEAIELGMKIERGQWEIKRKEQTGGTDNSKK